MLANPVSAEVGSLGSAFTIRCLFFPSGEVAICIFSCSRWRYPYPEGFNSVRLSFTGPPGITPSLVLGISSFRIWGREAWIPRILVLRDPRLEQ